MQSDKLAAGTGVLQTNTSDTLDDADLESVDEILSQHSNPRSCAGTASQANSPAISNPDPPLPSALHSYRHRHGLDAYDCHALAPAGAQEQAALPVIDLSDSSTPAKHANTAVQNMPHSHSGNRKAESLPEVEASICHARPAMHLIEETSNRGGVAGPSHNHNSPPVGPWTESVKIPDSKAPGAIILNVKAFDESCFAISSDYYGPLIPIYKQLASKPIWHPAHKLWAFKNETYPELMQKLLQVDFAVRVIPLGVDPSGATSEVSGADDAAIAAALKCPPPAVAADADVKSLVTHNIPASVFSRLYPFQREGVRFGVKHKGRVLLADEMGLGKTVQAICIAACYPEDWPMLIICPSSMRLVWYDALLNWLPACLIPDGFDKLVVIGNGKDLKTKLVTDSKPPRQHIVIISYDLVQKMQSYVKHFGVIICDESHALKSHSAKRTQFIRPLVQQASRAILITGTPALSRPIELFPQIDMLVPGLLGSRDEYGQRYCGGKQVFIARGMYDWRNSSNLTELNAVLQKHVLIRRLKKDVLQDLPAKLRQRIPIEVDPDCVKELERIKAEMAAIQRNPDLSQDEKKSRGEVKMRELYSASGNAKVRGAVEQVERALEEGGKVIVFGHHQKVLDGIQQKLGKAYEAMRIDGSTSMEMRKKAMDQFQQKASVRLAILSITAAGMGITLTAAQCVIFAELYWNPGHLVQAEDRAHRLGQQGCVQVRYLIAPGTVDDAMWPLLARKLQVVGKALDGHATGTATGLQISDASSFSDYIPTDSHQVATAAPPPLARAGPSPKTQQNRWNTPQASGLPVSDTALYAMPQQASASGQPMHFEGKMPQSVGSKGPVTGSQSQLAVSRSCRAEGSICSVLPRQSSAAGRQH
ncbi:TPA: hypothetical protein ACH3X2_005037 [Trebouxia sp. C0005]